LAPFEYAKKHTVSKRTIVIEGWLYCLFVSGKGMTPITTE